MPASNTPWVVSLFSGAGGLDVGLEQAGWRTAVATDFDPQSMETLRQAQARRISLPGGGRRTYLSGTRLIEADVNDLEAKDLWRRSARPALLAGGPPCQPWSSAGAQRGLSDPRGPLLMQMLRLTEELQPDMVLLENVQGLVTARGWAGEPGEVLRSIQGALGELGYVSRVAVLNSADFGAAQRRVRLLLMASHKHQLPSFPAPTHARLACLGQESWRSLGDLLGTLPEADAVDVVRPSGKRADELRALTPGSGLKTGGQVMANRPSGQWGYRQDSFLADLDLPSRTIRAASTPDWVRLAGDSDIRRLTWRECAALQGFPPEWPFQGNAAARFRQIGNAVQVDMARAVGQAMLASWTAGEAEAEQTIPAWPADLQRRLRYTMAEHKVNGHLRKRQQAS